MYDYPLDETWTTEEIIDVVALYNAVEQAYEEGIRKEDFLKAYDRYIEIVDSKMMQKQIERAFYKASTYSIWTVYKKAQEETEWVKV